VVGFAGAGAGPAAFRSWPGKVSPDIGVWAVLPPGRDRRLADAPVRSIAGMAAPVAAAVAALAPPPVVFFGHSMGALLAYETLRCPALRDKQLVRHLVVACYGAPHLAPTAGLHQLDDAALLRRISEWGVIPAEVLADRDLIELLIPTLRADLEACETYVHADRAPLPVPITVVGGSSDPLSGSDALRAWNQHTSDNFRLLMYDAGHFLPSSHEDKLLQDLAPILTNAAANSPPDRPGDGPPVVHPAWATATHGEFSAGPYFRELEELPVAQIPITKLATFDYLRSSGVNLEHVRILANSEIPLPPILVQRSTMRVLDGVHRLHAARLRGQREIEARVFDGDETSSFILAVQTNTRHGLPLSLTDRKAAAARILTCCPHWSDRAIAAVIGLGHRTVAAMRECPTGQDDQLDVRTGRDGRRRARDSAARRELVRKTLAENPNASLRNVARAAEVSPETVRRVKAGQPPQHDDDASSAEMAPPGRPIRVQEDRTNVLALEGVAALEALRGDPAFRSAQAGRILLQMLSAYQALQSNGQQFVDHIPPHCMGRVVAAARACVQGWQDFAQKVENKNKEALLRFP
jgi:surfactin synthase thioesterase subunit/ParB-like chromosome segregation protein Spo0J